MKTAFVAGKHPRGSRGPQTNGHVPTTPSLWRVGRGNSSTLAVGGGSSVSAAGSGFKPMQTNKQKAQRKQGSLDGCQVFSRGRGRLRQHKTQETSAPRPGCCVQETQTVTGRSRRRVQRLFGVTGTLPQQEWGGSVFLS